MQKPTLYGLEITLNCEKCKKEVKMVDFQHGKDDLIATICETMSAHKAGNYCTPPGCVICGGNEPRQVFVQSTGQPREHLGRDDCIRHLRKLVVDLEKRLPVTTVTYDIESTNVTHSDPPTTNTTP